MATIHDVARVAGVSRSTVSYALSGKRAISAETRERIAAAIDQLGFTPNAGARALKTAQTMVLGLLVQFFSDEFSPAMLQYVLPVSDAAREAGYDILMVTEADGSRALRRITESDMVDGVILLNVGFEDDRVQTLRAAPKPGALIGLPKNTEGLDVFDLDFAEAARRVIDHLDGLGHREVILISPHEHVIDRGGAYAWLFRDAALCRAAGYGIRLHSHSGEAQQPAIAARTNAVLDAHPDATALIVHNDATIAALPSILAARGISAPEDLSVVGIYSEGFGRLFSLPYTAIETSPDRLGRAAVDALVRRIGDPATAQPPSVQLIEPALIERGSTAAPPRA